MEATGAEKGMFSEEEQFYAYTEQSEESEVSTAGGVFGRQLVMFDDQIGNNSMQVNEDRGTVT